MRSSLIQLAKCHPIAEKMALKLSLLVTRANYVTDSNWRQLH
jgi:hypothetical protein